MKLFIIRENILKPLQKICNILHRSPNLKILNFILLEIKKEKLFITGSDLELELIAEINLPNNNLTIATTVAAKKFYSIIKELPENSIFSLSIYKDKLIINYQDINFYLSTLPTSSFPIILNEEKNISFNLQKDILENMINLTKFSMGFQDIRYYLNGMLFEIEKGTLKIVATDGYRLAIYSKFININIQFISIIIPRKGIIELCNILYDNNNLLLKIEINNFYIKIYIDKFIFISKLINGKFPNYQKILNYNNKKILEINRILLKNAFSRIAILANEKIKAIKIKISNNKLKIMSSNLEKEKAEETLKIKYLFSDIEIKLNYNYIIDILKSLKCENIRILLKDENSLIKIEDCKNNEIKYIIMPMII